VQQDNATLEQADPAHAAAALTNPSESHNLKQAPAQTTAVTEKHFALLIASN